MHFAFQSLEKDGQPSRITLHSEKGQVTIMGLALFVLLSILEIVLAVKGLGKEKEKWLRNRLFAYAVELAIVLIAFELPYGQRWRLVPMLGFLMAMVIVALLKWFAGRKKDNVEKKMGSIIVGCVSSVLFIGLFLVPAFLFAGYKGLPVSGQHSIAQASVIVIDRSRVDPFEQDGSFREVPMHFYYPAKAAKGEKFPLVVFSHGAFGYYQSNTSTYMELASNGYVVVALDHPHHAFFTKDTKGKMIFVDQDFFQTANILNNSDSYDDPEACYRIFREWMDLRTADMNCVLDALKDAAASNKLGNAWFLPENNVEMILSIVEMSDMTKIGLMGHSMGGATSVQVGRERDDIVAVIDLDGTMLGEEIGVENGKYVINQEPYEIPILEFANWEQYNDRKEHPSLSDDYPNEVLLSHAREGFYVTIRDTLHMDFTDLPMLSPILGNMLGSGKRDTAKTMTIVNGLVREFFNTYLKGEGAFSVQGIY